MTSVFGYPGNSQIQQGVTQNIDYEPQVSGIISLRNVTKTYPNGSGGLFGVNLEIQRGDFLFITGPSGAGKSTLLKLIYGAQKPTEGEVFVDQFNVGKLKGDAFGWATLRHASLTLAPNRLSLLRRRIGIVFQDYKLIGSRTVSENVAFVLWAQGFTRKEIDRRLPPTLKLVGLQHKANCFPDELSGGEQQRVSLARAIVGTPPVILADEPTGNLDPDNSRQVLSILQKLNAIGATVIVTTHDERLVQMANKPLVQLRDGRLYSFSGF